jgi:hypothetical protein
MVLPIDVQTVMSQMTNVGKMQQQQQLAALETQQQNRMEDAKKLKEMDEQIETVAEIDNIEVSDALKRERQRQENLPGKRKEQEDGDESTEKKPKGRIIDTVG